MTEKQSRQIYTVSKLTKEIKSLLEERYPFIWIAGEISNYAVPGSGHSYFTLKDNNAVISCVMFKNQKSGLKFDLENGLKIFGMARLSLYEPRGSYQLIFEHLEPEGAGSSQIAFEQLKKKLSAQGLFDDKYKKPIPFLPLQISIITSGTGAAVRDIVNISQRRFPNCPLEVISVKVQGEKAENEICNAINFVNQNNKSDKKSDLIILARGGGSLEDLAVFNLESIANAIFESDIPVITGIGHETDFTIADFTADLRAPTPSAAAELALPDKKALLQEVIIFKESLNISFKKRFKRLHDRVLDLQSRLKTPQTIIYDNRFRLEDYGSRLNNIIKQYLQKNRDKFFYLTDKLNSLNPESILKRGYSISRFVFDKKVIINSNSVKQNDQIEVILSKGRLITKVEKING
ncbi:MAG: exodeoxyribonuclease VII large subunit [Thermodesulfobacteriota bacterium]